MVIIMMVDGIHQYMYLISKTSSPCVITTYLPCWWPSGSPPFCRCTGNRKWWLRSQLPCCKWCPFLKLTPKTCTSNHSIYTCTFYSKIIFAQYVVASKGYSSKNYCDRGGMPICNFSAGWGSQNTQLIFLSGDRSSSLKGWKGVSKNRWHSVSLRALTCA